MTGFVPNVKSVLNRRRPTTNSNDSPSPLLKGQGPIRGNATKIPLSLRASGNLKELRTVEFALIASVVFASSSLMLAPRGRARAVFASLACSRALAGRRPRTIQPASDCRRGQIAQFLLFINKAADDAEDTRNSGDPFATEGAANAAWRGAAPRQNTGRGTEMRTTLTSVAADGTEGHCGSKVLDIEGEAVKVTSVRRRVCGQRFTKTFQGVTPPADNSLW